MTQKSNKNILSSRKLSSRSHWHMQNQVRKAKTMGYVCCSQVCHTMHLMIFLRYLKPCFLGKFRRFHKKQAESVLHYLRRNRSIFEKTLVDQINASKSIHSSIWWNRNMPRQKAVWCFIKIPDQFVQSILKASSLGMPLLMMNRENIRNLTEQGYGLNIDQFISTGCHGPNVNKIIWKKLKIHKRKVMWIDWIPTTCSSHSA